jgi:hypothetical protein
MSVRFDVISNVAELSGSIKAEQKAVNFAVIKALTRTARDARPELQTEMRKVFDRPTPYTLNSLFLSGATRGNMVARVWIKDERSGGGGIPATKFLLPQIEGGTRNQRSSERRLEAALVLPRGWFMIAARGAKRDQYGNWSRGELRQVLSWFQAAATVGNQSTNLSDKRREKLKRGTKKRRGFEFFAVRPGDKAARWLKPGIYRKTKFAFGDAVEPVAVFVQSVAYRPRLDFFGVSRRVAETKFNRNLLDALAEERVR